MLDATYSIFDIQTVQTSSENDDIGEMVKNALYFIVFDYTHSVAFNVSEI